MIRSVIVGCGHYLPEKVLTNHDLAKIVDTTDEWIQQRTGITKRHIAKEGELTSDLATEAAHKALKNAGVMAEDLDLIIVATTSPDRSFPATAVEVQSKLGNHHGFAFDVQAVCSGFIYALATADNFIKSGQVKTALVIGAETFSRLVDWTDRGTCVLFGDGAGAVVLKAEEGSSKGILATHLYSDGRYRPHLYADGGVSMTKTAGVTHMEGKEVFRHAVEKMSGAVETVLQTTGIKAENIDWVIPHQANTRIIEGVAKKLNTPIDKVIMTLDQHANTSAASIPLALSVATMDKRVKPGQNIVMVAMGAGFTWGSALIKL